ncbi:MAG: hypothetical protein ACK54F_09565 [Planctomycetia bacterium]|jgi:hypothetical protein
MATAAFSMPSDPRARISISGRSKNPGNATSAAADEALRRLIDDRRRRHKYGSEPQRRQSALGGAIGSVSDTIGESVSRLGAVRWGLTVVVVLAVGGLLFAGALMARPVARHSIAGTAMIDGKPLGRVTLVFHGKAPDGEAFTQAVFTAADGTFSNDPTVGIPAGSYAIVVEGGPSPRGKKAPVVPKIYADPAQTPLRVLVTEDLVGLKVLVRR